MPVRKCLSNYSNNDPNQLIWYDYGWIGQRESVQKTTYYDIMVTHIPTYWINFPVDSWRWEWQLE